jgi:hypothetical protein
MAKEVLESSSLRSIEGLSTAGVYFCTGAYITKSYYLTEFLASDSSLDFAISFII